MERLLTFLGTVRERPLGAVLVVGAGDGTGFDYARFASLAPQRLLLVEGEADSAAALERQVADLPWASVRGVAVAPEAGALSWRRYSVPAFDGPLDAAPLQAYYPRLRQTEQRELQAVAIASLLQGLAVPKHTNVIAFDVPGQEDALLAALPPQLVDAFEVISLRGCREALPQDGAPATNATQRLQKRSFRVRLQDERSEPLWPLAILRFDAGRHRLLGLEHDLAASREQQQRSAEKIAELEQRHEQLLAEARGAERRVAEHLQQVQQLTRASERDNALLDEREAQIAELSGRCESLRAAQDEQRERAETMQATGDAAAIELATTREALEAARAEIEEDADLEARRADAEARFEAASAQTLALEAQVRRLEHGQAQQAARQQMLQDELQRAEGQIDLIRGLLLGDAGI